MWNKNLKFCQKSCKQIGNFIKQLHKKNHEFCQLISKIKNKLWISLNGCREKIVKWNQSRDDWPKISSIGHEICRFFSTNLIIFCQQTFSASLFTNNLRLVQYRNLQSPWLQTVQIFEGILNIMWFNKTNIWDSIVMTATNTMWL